VGNPFLPTLEALVSEDESERTAGKIFTQVTKNITKKQTKPWHHKELVELELLTGDI